MELQKNRYKALVKVFTTAYCKIRLEGQFIWAGSLLELRLELQDF
jgi:hypothetical protein